MIKKCWTQKKGMQSLMIGKMYLVSFSNAFVFHHHHTYTGLLVSQTLGYILYRYCLFKLYPDKNSRWFYLQCRDKQTEVRGIRLPKVTKLVNGRPGIQTQVSLSLNSQPDPSTVLLPIDGQPAAKDTSCMWYKGHLHSYPLSIDIDIDR